MMSHHLDTPLARQNGRLYLNDLYVFGGDGSTVFIMDVNSTITGPDVTPGFHPEGRYEFKIHFDGADVEGLTYRVAFGERDSSGRQPYALTELAGTDAANDGAGGTPVLSGRTGERAEQNGLRMWAGRIEDPFYVDLDELSLVNGAVIDGTPVDLSSWSRSPAKNSFAGTTVESIVLEVSLDHPRLRPGVPVGVWATTKLRRDDGGWRRINRAGHPMMWPIFWPHDTDFTNPANDRTPAEDLDADGKHLAQQIATVVAANGTSADPAGYGAIVARRLLPDVLPYVIGTPGTFGFSGMNGRTLADNAPEVMFSLVLNRATTSGLGPSTTAAQRQDEFPYVVASP